MTIFMLNIFLYIYCVCMTIYEKYFFLNYLCGPNKGRFDIKHTSAFNRRIRRGFCLVF